MGRVSEGATRMAMLMPLQLVLVGETAAACVAFILDGVQAIGMSSPCFARREDLPSTWETVR